MFTGRGGGLCAVPSGPDSALTICHCPQAVFTGHFLFGCAEASCILTNKLIKANMSCTDDCQCSHTCSYIFPVVPAFSLHPRTSSYTFC